MTAALGYAPPRLKGLVSCPFCREMFPKGEARRCPHCDVDLVPPSKLAPSDEADDDLAATTTDEGEPQEEAVLPWTHLGHGRGALLACAVLGLVAFAMPWVSMTSPEIRQFTGIDLARRAPVAWAAGVAWFTLLPLVLSRRSVRKMLGARLAVAVLSIIPVITAGALLANPPRGVEVRGIVLAFRFTWQAGLYATLALGVASTLVGVLAFGGVVLLRSPRTER